MADIIPVTRRERILAAMAGGADAMSNLNEPIRRDERLLYEILQSGGGGGSAREWRIVQTLPETGDNSTIYLVPNSGSDPNIYDEYVWIDSESRFEVIGSTQIDLSDYVQTATNTSVDGGLASFSGTDGHTLKKAATVGTATKGVYIGSDGVPAAMTHSLETDVPSDAFDPATAAKKGVVKIGTNVDVTNDGTISVKDGSTSQKGVTQLSSSEDSESETLAATAKLANSKVKSVTAEKGLTSSTSNHEVTVKANLLSETPLTNASAAATETAGRVYPVALDKDGKLAANIPWTDTTYEPATKTADGLMEAGDKLLLEKHSKELSDIWEIVQQSDTAVYKTVTGNPVIISDGYDGGVIKSLIVTLPDDGTTVESVTIKRYAVKRTDDDSTQTVTATVDASTGELTPSEDVTTLLGENVIYAESDNTSLPLTLSYRVDLVYMQYDSYTAKSASGNPVTITDGADGVPVKDLTVDMPVIQSGSGDPSPDNIRPILPYDAAGNLLLNRIFAAPANANGKKEYTTNNPYAQENSGAGYIPATGYFKTQNIDNWVFNDGTSNLISLRDGYIRFSQAGTIYQWKEWSQMFKTMTGSSDISDFVGKTYTFSALVRTNKPGYSALIAAFASGNSSRAFTTKTNEWELLSTTFTVPENANINWLRAGFSLLNTTIDTYMDVAWADLREGVTMSLPAVTVFRNDEPAAVIAMSGGALYAGALNVTTGLLTVTHYMAKIYESNPGAWVIQNPDSDNRRFLLKITTSASGLLAPEIVDEGSVRSTAISNCFKWGGTPLSFDITAADNLRIFDPISNARWPTVQDLMNTLNELGMIVVYPVASPMTYQLTPAELTTLPGYNSISCDAKSISALTYRADPALAYQALETTLTNAVLSLGANL